MKFIKRVAFNLESDLKSIKAISEKKLISFAAHNSQNMHDLLRVYFVSMDNTPIAVFENVPYDLFTKILCARRIAFDNMQDSDSVRIAAFNGNSCVVADWISTAPVIWASLILSEYLVTDLQFFLDEGLRCFSEALRSKPEKLSGEEKHPPLLF